MQTLGLGIYPGPLEGVFVSHEAIAMLVCWAMFPTLIFVAVAVKAREALRARRWPAVLGKILVSDVQAKIKKPGDPGYNFHDTEVVNEPRVEYEYPVGGRMYRNGRITIGEKTSEYDLEDILARYPVGAEVTVYYDPVKPQTAVLERDLFSGTIIAGCACLILVFVVAPLGAIFGYEYGVGWLRGHVAHAHNAPFVAAAAGFGLLVLFFAVAYTTMIFQATLWPTAPGRIISSGYQEYEDSDDNGTRTRYKVSVIYRYEVNGRQYTGDRLRLGVVSSASFPTLAKRTARSYPVGQEVTVHFNPQKPGESVLHPYTNWHFLPWLVAAAMLWLAWSVATARM